MRDRLPVVPATAPEGCPDCTRRVALQALGASAAASLLGLGCGGDEGPSPDAADPLAGTMMCGADLCVLLNDPANERLASPDGSRVIFLPGQPLLVIRRDADAFVVLSARCTHQGCTVSYSILSMQALCPCHGSRFGLSGAVVQGPATVALKRHSETFDAAAQTLTIVL